MRYRDITFTDFIYAIKDKYKSMLVVAILITILGSSLSTVYVYNKEHDYQKNNIEIGLIESLSTNDVIEEIEKMISVTDKREQLNAYITAITPYADERQTVTLLESMEALNQDIMLYEYIIKFGTEVKPAEVTSLASLPEVIHNMVLGYIKENLKDINNVIDEINIIVVDAQLIGDNITSDQNIKIHDESKILSGDTYVYSYFTEKLDVHSTIIAYIIFFVLMGIAIGYLYGFIKFIKQNKGGRNIL